MTWTLLHDACEHQDTRHIIELAHDHSEQALKADAHGMTPLHIYIWGNPSAQAVQALLEASPQAVFERDVHGDTPLHIACSLPSVDRDIVRMLLEACPTAASTKNVEGLMPLHMACRYAPKNKDVIGLLIECNPHALRSHIKLGNPAPCKRSEKASTLKHLHDIVDPSAGMSAKSSVDLRFDSSDRKQIRDGAYPLHMAVSANAPLPVIEMLIKAANDVLLKTNKYGETPLHLALSLGMSEDIVETLVASAPAALHIRDKKAGNLPIHTAAQSGCSLAVAKLLLKGYPQAVEEINDDKLKPLELAIHRHGNCSDEVLYLLKTGNDS